MKKNIITFSSSLLTAIISLIIGVVLVSKPELVVILISYVLGSILIAYGLGSIIYYSYQKGKVNDFGSSPLITGIVLIIIGLICIFLSNVIEQVVRYLIGAYLLIKGINELVMALEIKNKDKSVISMYIIALLLFASGLYTIFNSNLVISGIGIILIIYSFIEIFNYVFARNTYNTVKPNKTKEVKVIEVKEKK